MHENPMTHEGPAGDWLDAALGADASNYRGAHIDDDGFTLRVMDALPAAIALPAWRRSAVAALWTAAAIGALLALPGAYVDASREAFRLLGGQAVSLSGLAGAIVAATVLTWAAAAYVLRSD